MQWTRVLLPCVLVPSITACSLIDVDSRRTVQSTESAESLAVAERRIARLEHRIEVLENELRDLRR